MSAPDLVSDLSALASAPRYRPGPPCTVQATVDRITAEDPEAGALLVGLLDDPQVSSTVLAQTLAARGHQVSPQSTARHRRRGAHNGCRCPQ